MVTMAEYQIKVLQRGDEHILANAAPGVFDNAIDSNLAKEFLEDRRHHIAVAIDNGIVVGFASAIHYINPDKPPELWINEVGIAPTHRGRGLGKAVLLALFQLGREHHCAAAWVLTDRGNRDAMALYASVGGAEMDSAPGKATVGYSFDLGSSPN
jgi:GNAT superfamily N-acetyltransferase